MIYDIPQTLIGTVQLYKGNGRKLGYPTANIASETALNDGVYFGFADLSYYKHHPALIFIGIPTTVGDHDRRVEAHLLDIPDKDYYGELLVLDVQYYHRPSKTFNSIDVLLSAMNVDLQEARQWFAAHR